jgi:hypothetical protein
MYRKIVLAPFVFLPLAGCTPVQVPVEVAEQQCLQQVQTVPPSGPTGSVAIGVNSDGRVSTGIAIGISTGSGPVGDPIAAFNNCVFARSGQMPRAPLGVIPTP